MKINKKLMSLVFAVALLVMCLAPITAQASSTTIPDWTLDFYQEGLHIVEDPYMGGHYSTFKIEPINGSLTFKFNAECALPKTSRYVIYLIDGVTNKTVQSFEIYATDNQYKTFNNLTSSSYYLKYANGYNPDIVGHMYVSSDNLFY